MSNSEGGPQGTDRPKRSLRASGMAKKFSASEQTIWRWTRDNPYFPKPKKLSQRCTVWDEDEAEEFRLNPRFPEKSAEAA